MSRGARFSLIGLAVLCVLALVVGIGGVALVRSDWFFQQVRTRLLAEAEKSSGGKVGIERFRFDWHTMTAEVDGLTIHGTEPAAGAPLLHASKVVVGLKIISLMKKQVDVASVEVTEPRVDLLIGADGRTNIPEPKGADAGKRVDDTILDLRVGRFGVKDGTITINAAGHPPKTLPWSVEGEKLNAQMSYGAAAYNGRFSIQPVHARYGNFGPIDAAVAAAVKFERDHLQVTSGRVSTATSQVDFSGDLRDLKQPKITGKYSARIAAQEVGKILAWRTTQNGIIDSAGDFRFNSAEDYTVRGNVKAADLSYRDPDLHFDHVHLTAKVDIDPKKVVLTELSASLLGGHVQGRATVSGGDRFDVKGSLNHAEHRSDTDGAPALAGAAPAYPQAAGRHAGKAGPRDPLQPDAGPRRNGAGLRLL